MVSVGMDVRTGKMDKIQTDFDEIITPNCGSLWFFVGPTVWRRSETTSTMQQHTKPSNLIAIFIEMSKVKFKGWFRFMATRTLKWMFAVNNFIDWYSAMCIVYTINLEQWIVFIFGNENNTIETKISFVSEMGI